MKKQNNKPQSAPNWEKLLTAEAATELKKVGALIAEARARRKIAGSKLAEQIGIDRRTLAQLEKGSPTVSLGIFFQVLSTLNFLRGIEVLLRPENDIEAMSAIVRRIRKGTTPVKPISDDKVEF